MRQVAWCGKLRASVTKRRIMRISHLQNSNASYFHGKFASVQQQDNEPCLEFIGPILKKLKGPLACIVMTERVRSGFNSAWIDKKEWIRS